MAIEIMQLQDDTNIAILNAIRSEGSTDYQRRIPEATKANVQGMMKTLHQHRPAYNEFLDALVNRIGTVFARNISWTNPLAEFKRGLLEFGDTIEEIQVGLLKAHTYDPDKEYMEKAIFGTERPHVESNFHHINRQDYYKITVNENLLQRAFLESAGLSSFVGQLMQTPSTSDQWDEFLLTVSLFNEYESNGGFYHVNVPDAAAISSGAQDARTALRKMRAMADTVKFPSTKYNVAGMPTFANAEDLCLFVTPEFNAAIDVEALAGAFNVDKAQMHGRIVPIPAEHFGIPGAQAIMTTRDFFVIADNALETTSQWNPLARATNYFLHHWEIVSASRFVPAVLFHTGADDEVITIARPVTSMSAIVVSDTEGATVTDVQRGFIYSMAATAVTTPADGDTAVRWSVSGNASTRTAVTQTGVLQVGADEANSSLTVTATSTWLDPENLRKDGLTVTATLGVVGPVLPVWPVGSVAATAGKLVAVDILGNHIDVVDGATAYTFVETAAFKRADVTLTEDGPISTTLTVSGRVATVSVDAGTGPAVAYTFTSTDV